MPSYPRPIAYFEDLRGPTHQGALCTFKHLLVPPDLFSFYFVFCLFLIENTVNLGPLRLFLLLAESVEVLVMPRLALGDLCPVTSPCLPPAALIFASNCMCKKLLLLLLLPS